MNDGRRGDRISWAWIVILFVIQLWPIAFILLFIKLFGNNSGNARSARKNYQAPNRSHTYQPPTQQRPAQWDWRTDAQEVEAQPVREPSRNQAPQRPTAPPPQRPKEATKAARAYQQQARPAAAGQQKQNYSYNYNYSYQAGRNQDFASKRLERKISASNGKGLQIAGWIVIGAGALAASITFLANFSWDFLEAVLYSTIVAVSTVPVGLSLALPGGRIRSRAMRCQTYYAMMKGRKSADIMDMAAAVPCSYSQACKDLRWMIHQGFFPGAYIDASKQMLIYAGSEVEKKEPPKAAEQPAPAKKPGVFPEVERIRQLNDEIADEFVSENMNKLEELTFKIFSYVEANPAKEERIRQFRQHYLPKTIKILESYARFERQGVNGANIRAAMKDVEEIMGTLVSGFEKQLDMLFVDEALDVTTDINVLESMMGIQGLGSDDPFRLELLGEDF